MKKFLLTTVALVALGATVPALAADLPARQRAPVYTKAPAYAPVYNWTGFYIGGHLGGAFSSNTNFGGLATGNNGNGRFLGGLQGGADYQFAPNWVIGAEAEYSWIGGDNGSIVFPAYTYTNNQRGIGSVTGRIGYTWGPGLLYVKGGYAFADNNQSLVTSAGAATPLGLSGDQSNGWTIGAGFEYMLTQNWSAKIEYQYYDFGSSSFTTPGTLAGYGSFRTDDHVVKAGINYRFNWGGPVVAKY